MHVHALFLPYLILLLFYRSVNWNYCVLDEGHVIKNTKHRYEPILPIPPTGLVKAISVCLTTTVSSSPALNWLHFAIFGSLSRVTDSEHINPQINNSFATGSAHKHQVNTIQHFTHLNAITLNRLKWTCNG